jgi:tripartite-type tricarboxylate transporter receptor subunit TctC
MRYSVIIAGLFLTVCGLSLGTSTAHAQPFPSRPIQLTIPNVPGSIMDINARVLTDDLGKTLGTQIIVIDKPGAASIFGTDFVAKSRKDGYTLGYLSASSLIYTRITHPETFPYDPDKDLDPLGLHLFVPLTVTVQASSPWKTFGELIDYAKKNPGKLRVSTIGVGAIDHFNLEIMQSITGAQFTHVPFKGGESVITALLGGHVEVTFDAFGKVNPHVTSGKLRILLISKKMPESPDIPTATELGYKQGLLSTWFAFYGPSGMPDEVKKTLVSAIEKAVKNPELKAKVDKMGFLVDYKSPSDLNKLVKEDYETANAIAIRIGLRK